ncbi:MAG: hypothetical protein IT324_05855 [Anaerolineae bacterium]|nr:hypothetical protein [Anaerolineae bacterium]
MQQMQKIPSEVHGVLDYMTGGLLIALPRLLRWPARMTNLVTGVALGHMAYSLMTNYELGLFKTLPFKTHLAIDVVAGAMFAAAPLLFKDEDTSITATMMGLGVYELAVTAMTNPEPYQEDWANHLVDDVRETISSRASDVREAVQSR